jgi:putative acetyltransferase
MTTLPDITWASECDLPRLLEVWETSVRATHLFVDEEHIQTFIPLVQQELATTAPLYCLRDADGRVFAFMAVVGSKIEMLFVAPQQRGNGAGRKLVEYAVNCLGANAVDVNEQNSQAVGFYERLGFRCAGRSENDPLGNPFPILKMRLGGSNDQR